MEFLISVIFIQKCLLRVLIAGCMLGWQQEGKYKRKRLETRQAQLISVEGKEGSSMKAGKLATLLLKSKVKVKNDNKQGPAKSRLGLVNLAPLPKAG